MVLLPRPSSHTACWLVPGPYLVTTAPIPVYSGSAKCSVWRTQGSHTLLQVSFLWVNSCPKSDNSDPHIEDYAAPTWGSSRLGLRQGRILSPFSEVEVWTLPSIWFKLQHERVMG